MAWELGALALLYWTTVRAYGLGATGGAATAAVLGLLWLAGSWRILRQGVYVSGYGVRIVGLAGSRTLRWAEVHHITVEPAEHRFAGLTVPVGATVVIRCRDGRRVNTPLWAHGVDFRYRPGAFRQAYQGLRARHAGA